MPLANGVSFTAASAGTGTFVFGSARSSFLTLAEAVAAGELADGQTVSYLAQDSLSSPTQREWGHGTFSASGNGSIARTIVLGGTAGPGTAVNFSVAPIVSLTVLAQDVRRVLTADTTFYVSTSGSDTTGDGSEGNPWATLQHANDQISLAYDIRGVLSIDIQIADGTYDGFIATSPVGSGNPESGTGVTQIVWKGNASDYTAVKIRENPNWTGTCILSPAASSCLIVVENLTCIGPLTDDLAYIIAPYPGFLQVGNYDGGTVGFSGGNEGDCFNGNLLVVDNVVVDGTGDATWDCLFASGNEGYGTANLTCQAAVSLVNNPRFDAVAITRFNSFLDVSNTSFTGAVASETRKFEMAGSSMIYTNGQGVNFLPGDLPGTMDPTCSYDGCSIASGFTQYEEPSTGFSQTINDNTFTLLLDPSDTLATGTVIMPPNPIDGQIVRIKSSATITALTFSPNSGQSVKSAPTTIAAGAQIEAIYRAVNTTWYF